MTVKYLRVKQVAQALQVSQNKVHQWISAGQLEAVNVGTPGKRPQWRIHPDALERLKLPRTHEPAKVIPEPLYDIDIDF